MGKFKVFIFGLMTFTYLFLSAAYSFDNDVKVKITDLKNGAYQLHAEFQVKVSPRIVWDVLTDYEKIHLFISTMQKSKITARYKNKLIVEQSASIPVMFWLKINRKVVLTIEEFPYRQILFTDMEHDQIEKYDGFWKIKQVLGGTHVEYQINVKVPSAPFDFLSERSLVEFSQNNLTEVLNEIVLRAGKPLSPTPKNWFWVEPLKAPSKTQR